MLEAGFLVLLAVVVGLADLSPALIIVVMTVGWLLVALIEYFAWRQAQGVSLRRFEAAPAVAAVHEEVAEEMAPPLPPPPPPPAPAPAPEEETIVQTPAAEETAPEPARADEPADEAEEGFAAASTERRVAHRLEPLQPRPRRKWILFGPYQRPEASAEGDREEER